MNKNEVLKKIGENIKKHRIRSGISQEELAERSGLHRTYISLMERGGKNIGIFNIINVAKSLSVSVDKLTKGTYD